MADTAVLESPVTAVEEAPPPPDEIDLAPPETEELAPPETEGETPPETEPTFTQADIDAARRAGESAGHESYRRKEEADLRKRDLAAMQQRNQAAVEAFSERAVDWYAGEIAKEAAAAAEEGRDVSAETIRKITRNLGQGAVVSGLNAFVNESREILGREFPNYKMPLEMHTAIEHGLARNDMKGLARLMLVTYADADWGGRTEGVFTAVRAQVAQEAEAIAKEQKLKANASRPAPTNVNGSPAGARFNPKSMREVDAAFMENPSRFTRAQMNEWKQTLPY